MQYLIYSAKGEDLVKSNLPPEYSSVLWRPSLLSPVPPTLGAGFVFWTFAHYLRLFCNRDYSVLFIHNVDGKIVHRSCLIPAYFRWPFMGRNDLQISSTWTDPEERGKGLATCAIFTSSRLLNVPGRKFWYVTREENLPSKIVCEKAGFTFAGFGKRVSWMGIRLLGKLILTD